MKCTKTYAWKGRLRAVFLCASIVSVAFGVGACAGDRGSPFVSTFASVLPGQSGDVSKQAAAIPYASVDLSVNGAGGLLILAEQSGGLTFWQSGSRETVVFRHGYLNSTRGLQANLLSSRQTDVAGRLIQPWTEAQGDSVRYQVERSWEDSRGRRHAGRAQASFECSAEPESVELPLATFDLTRCVESLQWESGKKTRSVVWRHPDTHRVWAGDAVAWPGGLQVTWQVARPWW